MRLEGCASREGTYSTTAKAEKANAVSGRASCCSSPKLATKTANRNCARRSKTDGAIDSSNLGTRSEPNDAVPAATPTMTPHVSADTPTTAHVSGRNAFCAHIALAKLASAVRVSCSQATAQPDDAAFEFQKRAPRRKTWQRAGKRATCQEERRHIFAMSSCPRTLCLALASLLF